MALPHALLLALFFASPLPRPVTADDGVAAQPPPIVQEFYYYSPPPPSPPLTGGGVGGYSYYSPPPPSVPCNCETTTPAAPSPPGIYSYSAPGGQFAFFSGSHLQAGGRLHPRLLCAAAAGLVLAWWC